MRFFPPKQKYVYFSILCFLFLFSSAVNAQAPSVYKKGTALIKFIKLKHVQPRDINDDFANSVHQNILSAINSEGSFFTSEEIILLNKTSIEIDDNLLNENGSYLDLLKSMYQKNIARTEAYRKVFFNSKINIKSPLSENVSTDTILSESNFNSYWDLQFKLAIQKEILETLQERGFSYQTDSLDIIIEKSINATSSDFADYFKNLISDSTFIDNHYLNAIAESFDPHSNYFTASQNESFTEELSSERELFGISYYKNNEGIFEITNVYPGSSAWLSGEIHVGDQLLKLQFGDEPPIKTEGKTTYEIHQLFSASESKELKLTTKSNGELKTTLLLKTKVYSDSDIIKSAVLEGEKKVGYIALPDFYTNWTDTSSLGCANDLAKALIKLKKEQIEGVILDLRDNGGGSLYEAIDLVGTFIDYGPVLIVKNNHEVLKTLKDFNRGAIYRGPLIVLINEYSASASEVVAGAIQDYNRGLIVGQTSFGKATGQGVEPLIMQGEVSSFETVGFAKITGIGLYRIDLTTNQLNGVVPDIQLSNLFERKVKREEHYPNVLALTPIDKKMYYTPMKEISTESLISLSENRQSTDPQRAKIQSIINRLEETYNNVDYLSQSLIEIIELEQEAEKIKTEYYNLIEDWHQEFKPSTNQFDAEIYRMNAYLNTYNQDFHHRISIDYELGEAYQIMLDLINQNNK